jgi:hypothetical protein
MVLVFHRENEGSTAIWSMSIEQATQLYSLTQIVAKLLSRVISSMNKTANVRAT